MFYYFNCSISQTGALVVFDAEWFTCCLLLILPRKLWLTGEVQNICWEIIVLNLCYVCTMNISQNSSLKWLCTSMAGKVIKSKNHCILSPFVANKNWLLKCMYLEMASKIYLESFNENAPVFLNCWGFTNSCEVNMNHKCLGHVNIRKLLLRCDRILKWPGWKYMLLAFLLKWLCKKTLMLFDF